MISNQFSYEEFSSKASAAHQAMLALGKAVDASGLEKSLSELCKIRASQLNGCAFCLQYHLNLARQLGLAKQKLDLIACWQESTIFSERERTALAYTETLTLTPQATLAPSLKHDLNAYFQRDEILFLSIAIATINSWNRIAGSLHFPAPEAK